MSVSLDVIADIKGFLDVAEGMRLFDLALEASRTGPCLEIGSYCGKSAIYLGTACRENGEILFSVDHHRGSEEQQPGEEYFDPDLFDPASFRPDSFPRFRRTIEAAGLESTVVPVVAPSAVVARSWKTPLAMVFIDGGHAFETAFADYTAWSPHLVPGGILAIHDIFPDPADGGQAPFHVYKRAMESGRFREREMTRSLGVLERTGG